GLPPANQTVPSGSSSETEWYSRAYEFAPADEKVLVAGSYKSAFRLAVVVSSSLREPPVARTLPLGRIVAFISIRGWDMLGPQFKAGVVAPRSMVSVVAVEGFPPPMMITRGS